MARVQPASIQDKDGNFKSYFPGEVEELIEEALKKILTEQNHGIHLSEKKETWVRFSLQQIRKELNSMGRSIKLSRLKHAIDVMSSSILSVYRVGEKDPLYRGPLLSDVFITNRDDFLNDSSTLCTARLPVFISYSIDKLSYRQFNYECYMQIKKQFSRWLFKKLVNRYTQASIMNNYHFSLNSVSGESGHLQASTLAKRKALCEAALDELKSNNVVFEWSIKSTKNEGRKFLDVVYELKAHPDFIGDQKAANKRETMNKKQISG